MPVMVAALITALMAAAAVGLVVHHHRASPRSGPPTAGAVPPRSTRPGAATTAAVPTDGSTVLSEPVDRLSLDIPAGWTALPTSPIGLPDMLHHLATQNAQLAGLLNGGQVTAAAEGAIRLFAYTGGPPVAFASILSYASPGSPAISQAMGAALAAAGNRRTPDAIVDINTVQIPAGLGLRIRNVAFSRTVHLAFENLVVISSGRAIVLQMAADVKSLAFPDVFSVIEASIRID